MVIFQFAMLNYQRVDSMVSVICCPSKGNIMLDHEISHYIPLLYPKIDHKYPTTQPHGSFLLNQPCTAAVPHDPTISRSWKGPKQERKDWAWRVILNLQEEKHGKSERTRIHGSYTRWLFNVAACSCVAMENHHRNSDFSIFFPWKMVDLSIVKLSEGISIENWYYKPISLGMLLDMLLESFFDFPILRVLSGK
jgi:hypothetical protein